MSAETDLPAPAEPGDRLARNVLLTTATLVIARVVALAAGVVALSLASRYLPVRSFGALTAGMAYASLFAILTDLGLSTAGTREISRAPGGERGVLGNVLGMGLASAVVAAGLGLLAMEVVYPGAGNASTRQAIEILLIQVFVAPVTGAARAFFIARQRGYLIAWGDVALPVGMAVFIAVAVAGNLGYRAVVIAITAGYVVQALAMAAIALAAGVRVRYHHRSAVRLMKVALPLGGVLLINYLYFRLDVLLLSWMKSNVDVARYGLAYRVIEGLMVLPSYVMLALFPSIARSEEDPGRLGAVIGVALAGLEAIALPVAALTAIFSPQLVVLFGGPKYAAAAPVLAILAVALGISYVAGVYGNALIALGRQRTLFWLGIGPLVVNLLVNLALIPPLGPTGAAVAVVISELVVLLLCRRYYIRIAGPPSRTPHLRILAAGIGLGVIAAVKFALPLGGQPVLTIVLGGMLAAVLYAALLLRLGGLPAPILDQLPFLPTWLIRTPPRP